MKKTAPDKKSPAQQAEYWFTRAITSYRKNDLESARRHCEKAANLNPRRSEYWEGVGIVCQQLKDYATAAKAFGKVVQREPDDHGSWNLLGLMQLELNSNEAAKKSLQRAVRLNPEDDIYWQNLAYAFSAQEKNQEAADCYLRATALKPDEPVYWQLLGDRFSDMDRNPEAIAAYQRAIKLKPRDHVSWHNLALATYQNDGAQAALPAYSEAARLKPNNAFYAEELAHVYRELGQLGPALKFYRHAMRIKPAGPGFLTNFGVVCEEAHRYGEAAHAFRRAAAISLKKYPDPIRHGAVKKELSQPRVFSASIDLKLTPEGKIKICEFNDLWLSGFEGFKCVTGKDMVEDIVRPFYNGLLESWKGQGLPVRNIVPRNEEEEQDILAFFAAAGKRRQTVIPNADPGFQALCIYKDFLPAIAPDDLRDFAPRTRVVPVSQPDLAADISCDDSKLMVIKPSDALQGKGVEIVTAGQLPGRVGEIAALYKNESAGDGQFWSSNIHPNILVQDCEQSVPVAAADGLLYDGTMRVAFTAVFNPGSTVPQISFHGAYWKIPERPCTESRDHDSIVSFSPSAHLTGNTEEAFAKKPFAAPVSPEHCQAVEAQLETFLTRLLPLAVSPPRQFLTKVLGMMDSGQEWIRALGTRLATEHGLGNVLAKEAGAEAPVALATKMKSNQREHAGDAAALYLKQIFSASKSPRTHRESQLLSDVAEYLKKGRIGRDLAQSTLAFSSP